LGGIDVVGIDIEGGKLRGLGLGRLYFDGEELPALWSTGFACPASHSALSIIPAAVMALRCMRDCAHSKQDSAANGGASRSDAAGGGGTEEAIRLTGTSWATNILERSQHPLDQCRRRAIIEEEHHQIRKRLRNYRDCAMSKLSGRTYNASGDGDPNMDAVTVYANSLREMTSKPTRRKEWHLVISSFSRNRI
jgi:hypothetical protein